MKIAVIADVHANLVALESVLDHIREQGVDTIWCLGDIIGYGPDPRACMQAAGRFAVNILGDHEEAVCLGAIGFNPMTRIAIDWTRGQLNLDTKPQEENRDLWNFLGRMEKQVSHGPFLLVHASPREPTREYLFKQDCRDPKKMDEVFSCRADVDWRVCLAGHSHQSGVFVQGDPCVFLAPAECGQEYRHAGLKHRILVSVGSVGQPRDGDWRASYVTVDDEMIHFHRVEYDQRRTIERYEEVPELPARLAHLPGTPFAEDELAATGRLREITDAASVKAAKRSRKKPSSP
jgi:predicted phosphodiesterase